MRPNPCTASQNMRAPAALASAPDADVVFVAHHGFPHSMRDAWRDLPLPTPVEVELWLVRAEEIPAEHDARIDWLFEWWRRLDRWVGERRETSSARR